MQYSKSPTLLHAELSYKIIGACYEVINELGPGHLEKVYQKALGVIFAKRGIPFQRELPIHTTIEGVTVGKSYLDFLIEDRVILELKKDTKFSKNNIDQVKRYLAETGLELGLLVNFTRDGVIAKRIVNLKGYQKPSPPYP